MVNHRYGNRKTVADGRKKHLTVAEGRKKQEKAPTIKEGRSHKTIKDGRKIGSGCGQKGKTRGKYKARGKAKGQSLLTFTKQ